MGLIYFCFGSSDAVAPLEVAPFRLLDPLGAMRVDMVGVCCEATGAGFTAVEPSSVISAMMSSRLFFSVAIRVTLIAAASSFASISSEFSLHSFELITFSLPLLEGLGLQAPHLIHFHHLQ